MSIKTDYINNVQNIHMVGIKHLQGRSHRFPAKDILEKVDNIIYGQTFDSE